ncbi:hypothetical protein DFH09DRAFT_1145900 [Mycena vulgaris]|nr:hypothetical protein DFH09DRAFT_1145900 [Mycena vulgaris]
MYKKGTQCSPSSLSFTMNLYIAALLASSIAILFPGAVLAELTFENAVDDIDTISGLYRNINTDLGGLSTASKGMDVKTMSQTVAGLLSTISDNLDTYATEMHAAPPFDEPDAIIVGAAFDDLVEAHQALLSSLNSKHNIFAQFEVAGAIAEALRNLHDALDSISFAMVDLIPDETPSVLDDNETLDQSVRKIISLYEQSCIPSLVYPLFPPFCRSP